MKKSKIAEILSKFSKDEIKSFEKFIISPYFASRRDVKGYFALLKKYHPDFNIDRVTVFKELFPEENYNERKMKNLSAQLVKLAEEFLVHNYCRSNEEETGKFLAIQYKNKKLEKLFLKKHGELADNVEKKLFNSFDGYKDTEELDKLMASYFVENNKFDKYVNAQSAYTGHFTTSFIVRYLKCYTDSIVLKMGYGFSINNPVFNLFIECVDFEKLIALIENKDYEDVWLVRIYYYGYMAHNKLEENKYYEIYKNEFYKNVDKFSRMEKHFLFSSLTDLHLMKRGKVKSMSQTEIFDIHKRMLAEEAFSVSKDEPMDIVLFRNILLLSLELRELEWVENFINTFTEKLLPKFRTSAECFAKAWLHFEKGEFESALTLINKIHFDIYMYKVDVRYLQMGIYYELELYEQAYSLIDSFRHFAKEGPKERKKARQFEIKLYHTLLQAKTSEDYSEIDILIQNINNAPNHIFRNWILRKAAELIKRK